MAWRRPGDKPLSEPMVVSLPTHIWVAWPQWVNWTSDDEYLNPVGSSFPIVSLNFIHLYLLINPNIQHNFIFVRASLRFDWKSLLILLIFFPCSGVCEVYWWLGQFCSIAGWDRSIIGSRHKQGTSLVTEWYISPQNKVDWGATTGAAPWWSCDTTDGAVVVGELTYDGRGSQYLECVARRRWVGTNGACRPGGHHMDY